MNGQVPMDRRFLQSAVTGRPRVVGEPQGGLPYLSAMKAVALGGGDFRSANVAGTLQFDLRPPGFGDKLPSLAAITSRHDGLRLELHEIRTAVSWAVTYFLGALLALPKRGVDPLAGLDRETDFFTLLSGDGVPDFAHPKTATARNWRRASARLALCGEKTRERMVQRLAENNLELAFANGLLLSAPIPEGEE
jgi:hypothetical protein